MSLKNKSQNIIPINTDEKKGLSYFHDYVMSLLNEYADILSGEYESINSIPPVNRDIVIAYASSTFESFRKRVSKKYKVN